MNYLLSLDWLKILDLVNGVLSSGIAIFSAALLIYLAVYSARNAVARSFIALLSCVLVVYFVDLAVFGVEDATDAIPWLRLQWLGIAYTPAAYLNFSSALLITTGARNRAREVAARMSYVLSTAVFLAAAFTDLLVRDGILTTRTARLQPASLFPLFTGYFLLAVLWGGANVLMARNRCLTSTSRRRMSYLAATFAAPAAGVFPYLLLTGLPPFVPETLLWLLLVVGNIGVGLMLVLFAYSVAFFGTFTSERVTKHRLVRFLLRGPFLATLVVVVIITASASGSWLGLSGGRLMLFGVVGVILALQLTVELSKPVIDRLLYREGHTEIQRIQKLSSRFLTATDLRQFLENVLTALCDLLRVESAFVAAVNGGQLRLEVVCGPLGPSSADDLPPEAWKQGSRNGNQETAESVPRRVSRYGRIFSWDGYWLVPLYAQGESQVVIGVIGVAARTAEPDLTEQEWSGLESLLLQAAVALEDRQIQQSIFAALETIVPEIEDIQRRRGVVHYVGEQAVTGFEMVEAPEFRNWVRDALTHYWGGPKLLSSPLLDLRVVETAAQEGKGNALQGLRAVLKQAIESLRPTGQRQMATPEWVLYNILELKFLQGRKVREIARRLAMSESDLYRKQRLAIEAVAQVLAEMELEDLTNRDLDAKIV